MARMARIRRSTTALSVGRTEAKNYVTETQHASGTRVSMELAHDSACTRGSKKGWYPYHLSAELQLPSATSVGLEHSLSRSSPREPSSPCLVNQSLRRLRQQWGKAHS